MSTSHLPEHRDGFYPPELNAPGTEGVGYEFRKDGIGRYAAFNACFGKQLTGWHNGYSECLAELRAKERAAWATETIGYENRRAEQHYIESKVWPTPEVGK